MSIDALKKLFGNEPEKKSNKLELSKDEFKNLVEELVNQQVELEKTKLTETKIKENSKPVEQTDTDENKEFDKFIIELGDK
ncbi:MAG: hypothetical protein ACRCUM_02320 [Mycoplasmoidaceae bacterium]